VSKFLWWVFKILIVVAVVSAYHVGYRSGEVILWSYIYLKIWHVYLWYTSKPFAYYKYKNTDLIKKVLVKKNYKRFYMNALRWYELPNILTTRLQHLNILDIPSLKWLLDMTYLSFWNFTTLRSLTTKKLLGSGFIYLRGLIIVFLLDAILTDDEPIWEPVEWSLVQNWLMFIFLFAWIAENLISSRYGSYTGRDKRVWFSWYKTFWLIESYYIISLGAAALFVIVPFYHELTYTTPFILSWWDWYSRTFFLKFLGIYSLVLLFANYLQITISQSYWKKSLVLVVLVNIFLAYLIYVHFFITFFAYFTDPNWYCSNRLVDYIQLSHEPSKWSWGAAKRDHFSYHNSKTVFWFKNDGPFASAMLFFNILFFLSLFTLHIYWLTLVRRIYATGEVTFTYTTYCVSGLRQFFYFFNFLYCLTFFSYVLTYLRLPLEFYWTIERDSWFNILLFVIIDYSDLVLNTLLLF